MVSNLSTPEPHFVPGYTGYCPQYIFRSSNTYGALSHKLLIDPCTNHAETIILPNPVSTKREQRPTFEEINLVKGHEKIGDPIYKYPTIPGYYGFVPFLKDKIGARFAITSTEGIAEFEKLMLQNKCEAKKLKHRVLLQDQNLFRKSIGERSLDGGNYKMPLIPVRPEARAFALKEDTKKSKSTFSKHYPPHFMKEDDPGKYVISGFGGSVPFAWPIFGQGNKPLTNAALRDFFRDYNHRQSIEWTPVTNDSIGRRVDSDKTFEIYWENDGVIPCYAGHVPGERFEFGKTYFRSTINAKGKLEK